MLNYVLSENRTTSKALGGAWLAGFLWNLSMTVYVAFPHWATSIGWVALSAYMAFYWLIFAWGCRLALKKKVPIWFAAPVLWTGLELIQGHLLSGFLLNQQAIIFYKAPVMLQLAEFGGSYAVSFIVILLSAQVYLIWKKGVAGQNVFGTLFSLLLIVGLVLYSGIFLLNQTANKLTEDIRHPEIDNFAVLTGESEPTLNIAMIQGNIPCQVGYDSSLAQNTFALYCTKTFEALDSSPRPDIIVWPEGIFRSPRLEIGEKEPVPNPEFTGTKEQFLEIVHQRIEESQKQIGVWAKSIDACFITGVDRYILSGEDVLCYNSIVGVDSLGRDIGQYDKRHLVMFGEYIPFSEQIPLLKEITPVGGGMQFGQQIASPMTFQKENSNNTEDSGWIFLPSICYENTLPHIIRAQIIESRKPVDALLNLSNDGWFKGSFENELRMAQSVFRAIETRKTNLVASNGGLSAYISPTGHILQRGQRETQAFWGGTVQSEFLVVSLKKNAFRDVTTKYVQFGDAFACCCLFLSLIILFNPLVRPSKSSKPEIKAEKIDKLKKI